ncbi:MAG: hypothetical protein IKS29_05835 [Oscillospiraceae bacterium]|nr:hypothetical protein [Oscillospiraceae bacterium]
MSGWEALMDRLHVLAAYFLGTEEEIAGEKTTLPRPAEEQDEAEPAAWPEGGRTPYEAAQMLLRRVRVQEWTPPRQGMEADQPGQAPLTGWEPEGAGFSGKPEPAADPDALERTQIRVQGGTGNMDPEEMSQAFRRDARRYDE